MSQHSDRLQSVTRMRHDPQSAIVAALGILTALARAHPSRRFASMPYAALLFLFLVTGCITLPEEAVHVGNVQKISDNHLEIDQGSSFSSIGFIADSDVVRQLETIKQGDEVRAIFGGAPGKGKTRTNRLLSIRHCAEEDAECSADRRKREERDAALQMQISELSASYERCQLAMNASLPEKFRDALKDSKGETRSIPDRNALSAEERMCSKSFIEEYRKAFFDACNLNRCGENIGGGCSHLAGYSTTNDLIDASIRSCRARTD
jgi:hypothetical protein